MRFKKVKRPVLHAPQKPGGERTERRHPVVVRLVAEMCPSCHKVGTLHTNRTVKRSGQIIRYSVCRECGQPVTRVYTVPSAAKK